MDNKITKKDINQNSEVTLLSEGSTEDMLLEYAEQMFNETIADPLLGIQNDDHAGFALKMEDGLEFMYIRSRIPRDRTLIRRSHNNRDMLAIYFFYGSTFDYYVENKMERNVEGLINGIIIHNYSSSVKVSLLKDREFNFVVIRIKRATLIKYFKSIAEDLNEILFSKKPVLMYENLDQNVLDHLKSVSQIQSLKATSRYLIFGKSIELLALTFDLILTRSHESKVLVKIPEYDHVVQAKDYLVSDWQNPPTIKQLSQFMGMCPTKAKMLFRQVFGYPPHQYFKRKKMEMAYQLIKETNYGVSEIGRQLGYRSLSHFSSDFKKHYGTLPKKLMIKVKNHH
jgi:AraC-like DNA-binding protein